MRVSVVGTGRVGATIGFALVAKGYTNDAVALAVALVVESIARDSKRTVRDAIQALALGRD